MKFTLTVLLPWATAGALGGVVWLEQNKQARPATDWLDVRSVVVHETHVGKPIVLSVERTIKQPFFGEWNATVRQFTNTGFTIVCAATGANEYQPGAMFPQPLTLDWWMFPVKCQLGPGQYRLDTVWTVKAPGYPEKYISVRSNLFHVRP